jgi:3-oxoacyl-[acyl-carrier-protein] synthase-3
MFAVTYYSETACIFIRLQRLAPGGLFKLNLAPPEAPLSRDREGAVSGATNPPTWVSTPCSAGWIPAAAMGYSKSLRTRTNLPKAKITALGCYTPPGLLTNLDLEKLVETNNQWILDRTGIRQRHIAAADMATSDMAVEAAKCALEQRGVDPAEVNAIILCTVTPDYMFPSTACLVQNRLGARGAWGFDLIAACSGFVYGTTVGAHLVAAGTHKKVLVIGADTMSRIIDYTDRATCVLFGDGAGAVLIEPVEDGEEGLGFLDFIGEIDGSGGDALKMPAGGSRMPASHESVDQRLHYVHQDGSQVFKYAVRKMYESCRDVLARNGLTSDDVAVMIPHQANKRIITAAGERLGIAPEKVLINIDSYGNTTAATIPLATRDAIQQGRLKKGDLALLAAVGAGYTVGASLWRWAY